MNETYVDTTDYVSKFEGNVIPSKSFKKYAIKASSKVKYYTFGRIREVDDSIRNATCEIAELLFKQEEAKSKITNNTNEKASESVGPWSVTYVNKTQYQSKEIKTEKELNNCIYQICKEYLDANLLFRGVTCSHIQ